VTQGHCEERSDEAIRPLSLRAIPEPALSEVEGAIGEAKQSHNLINVVSNLVNSP